MNLQSQRKLDMKDTSRSTSLTSLLPHTALSAEPSVLQRPRPSSKPKQPNQLRSGETHGEQGQEVLKSEDGRGGEGSFSEIQTEEGSREEGEDAGWSLRKT